MSSLMLQAADIAERAECSIGTARKYLKAAGYSLARGKGNVTLITFSEAKPIIDEIKKNAKKAPKKAAPAKRKVSAAAK